MSTTITYPGGSAIVPDFAVVGSADATVTSRTITHEILDGPPVYTMRATRPQTGTIVLLFSTSARAHAAKDRLTAAAVYTISSDDDASLNFRLIVRTVTVQQNEDARAHWTVRIGYEAVS